jgi:hypothetical protein
MKFLNSSKGGVGTVVIFLGVMILGAVIFNSTLVNKSTVDTTKTYHLSDISTTTQKQNLQLDALQPITETPTLPPIKPTKAIVPTIPPPQSSTCPKDGFVPFDPNSCQCTGFLYQCVGHQALVNGQHDALADVFCKPRDSDGYYCFSKPVIYLYPQNPTYVTVTLSIPGKITTSIPPFEGLNTREKSLGGWKDVLALPSGVLKYKNNFYRELFYESSIKDVKAPDNGMFLASSNLEAELFLQTEKLGLNPLESKEFVAYWLPTLKSLNKKYIFFSILTQDEKERTDKVTISPRPDNFIEFIAYFKGVDEKFETQPFIYPTVPVRTGFTAVEWGGTIDY